MKYLVILSFLLLGLSACSSSKKKAEVLNPRPDWITSRPVTPSYYTGIGIARKWGTPDNYKSEARQKALSDMAAQISTNISSTSVLYQLEDKQGVTEILSNNIKASSREYLEGYEELDSYEDEVNYYVYYRLSKIRFAELKTIRKQTASENAQMKYAEGLKEQENGNTFAALKLFGAALESMSAYLGEDNSAGQSFDVCVASIKNMRTLMNQATIMALKPEITAQPGGMVDQSQLTFKITDAQGRAQSNVPVKFKYSAGYLRKETDLSTAEGTAGTTINQVVAGSGLQTLCGQIDVINLTRNITKDLLVRKLFDDVSGQSSCIQIKVSQ